MDNEPMDGKDGGHIEKQYNSTEKNNSLFNLHRTYIYKSQEENLILLYTKCSYPSNCDTSKAEGSSEEADAGQWSQTRAPGS